MWLEKFRHIHSEAAKRFCQRPLNLEKVEGGLLLERELSTVRKSTLDVLEKETDYWTYDKWWRELSSCLKEDEEISIPQSPTNLGDKKAREGSVEKLFNRFKQIESVSVLLRFLYPEEYGILSFPVIHLINLSPSRKPVRYYLDYLEVLRGFRDNPKYRSNNLKRVADIDLALWSAAHFCEATNLEPEFAEYREEMYQDDYFQEVRLRNLLKGLSRYGKLADSQCLLFASVLLEHDCQIAAAVAAKPYDNLIHKIAERFRVERYNEKGEPRPTRSLIEDLRQHEEKMAMRCDDLHTYWGWRIKAVHDVGPPISKDEAVKFVNAVADLLRKVHN